MGVVGDVIGNVGYDFDKDAPLGWAEQAAKCEAEIDERICECGAYALYGGLCHHM